ncbi:MAG: SUMF1/EgtB/PvdO family nonheme iron enzyme [Clostridia bacterium]|nr:SUMF1/EgtB/PvdO family nonheme iron enzyme [Clostridia bacterium]
MGGKLSPLIIIVLIVVLVLVGGLLIKTITADDGQKPINNTKEESFLEEPIITLNKETNEEMEGSVIITAYASTESGDEITEITLPDGVSVPGATATYTATQNGIYEFFATAKAGGTSSAKIEVVEIPEISATNPYVPEGFTVIADNVEEGFVISDEFGNQYVWIPVETGKLTRKTMLDIDYAESSGTSSALVNSVAKYYGFYMGRFEASQYERNGEVTAASMSGKIPWTNITYLNAAEHAENSARAFGYTDCSTALISSHAWDTTVAWIDLSNENYSSDVNFGNYTGTIYPTGTTTTDTVRNICDLAGNVREWTTEIYKAKANPDDMNSIQRVVRGGSANLKRTPISHIFYPENTSDNYWGFRLMLYK